MLPSQEISRGQLGGGGEGGKHVMRFFCLWGSGRVVKRCCGEDRYKFRAKIIVEVSAIYVVQKLML